MAVGFLEIVCKDGVESLYTVHVSCHDDLPYGTAGLHVQNPSIQVEQDLLHNRRGDTETYKSGLGETHDATGWVETAKTRQWMSLVN